MREIENKSLLLLWSVNNSSFYQSGACFFLNTETDCFINISMYRRLRKKCDLLTRTQKQKGNKLIYEMILPLTAFNDAL